MTVLVVLAAMTAGPVDVVRAALDDLVHRVPSAAQPQMRYLSLDHVPPGERKEAAAVVSFVINSVSRSQTIVLPEVVPGTKGALLRIDLARLAPRVDDRREWAVAWERLVADDPYFHLKTEVVDPTTTKRRQVFTDGGWVDLAAAAELRARSGSAGAVLRGDWFVVHASAPPFYYELTGVPRKKEAWLGQLGLDASTIVELRANRGANLFRSRVTAKLRRISRWPAPLGYLWNTYDSADQVADKDVFRNPAFTVRFDAGEHIASRGNGLLEYTLFNAAGERQDAVPGEIAIDDTVHPAVPLVPMLSCVRCHAVDDGLRSFVDDQSRLLGGSRSESSDGVELYSDDPNVAEQLAAFYGRQRRLQRELERDREDYRAAVAAACGGRTPVEVAKLLAALVDSYATELVTPATACRELGLAAEEMPDFMRRSADPVVLALCEGISVQRAQWEASFGTAALLAAEHVKQKEQGEP